jgi:DNA-binding transcriptional MerR regulator
MKIGEIAQRTHVSRSIIRYYEDKGVLPPAARNASGYREYGQAELERIQLVTGIRRLGCSFAEIREIVQIWDEGRMPCEHIMELLDKKIFEVGAEVERLQLIRKELSELKAVARHLPRTRQLALIQVPAD